MTIGVVIEPTGQVITIVIRLTAAHTSIDQKPKDRLAGLNDTNLPPARVVPDHREASEAGLKVADSFHYRWHRKHD